MIASLMGAGEELKGMDPEQALSKVPVSLPRPSSES